MKRAVIFEASLGQIHKFGRNPDVDIGEEDIWTVGGERTWLTSASTLEVISDDANDDVGGTGAMSVIIEGLDENFDFASETVAMNGVSASDPTTKSFIRVNRVYVAATGTYNGNNIGNIIVRISSGGATQAEILAGIGQTEQTHYSVSVNRRFHLASCYISVPANKSVDAALWWRPFINSVSSPFAGAKRKQFGITGFTGFYTYEYVAFPSIQGPCDIWASATSNAANVEIEFGYDGFLGAL
jgi:hypothetical protein